MATTKIPQGVLDKLTCLVRRFFWGKLDRTRYLALLAWDKITQPVTLGGLGLRDFRLMNSALLMKMLWRLASDSDTLWVKQLKGKYLPRSDLWHSQRKGRCTVFWGAILALRSALEPLLCYKFGDGRQCQVYAQPWFPNAIQHRPQVSGDRRLRVADLLDSMGNWNIDLLAEHFGYTVDVQVVGNLIPPTPEGGSDRLIFLPNSNGTYSVKKGYAVLKGQQSPQADQQTSPPLWKHIWKEGEIPPRIRLFMWKLAHGALPLGSTMCSRLGRGDPTCLMCGQAEENETHLSFLCPFSRLCWYVGELGIKSDGFTGQIKEVLISLIQIIPDDMWSAFASTLWSLWRCRNDQIFQGKVPDFQNFIKYYRVINLEISLMDSQTAIRGPSTGQSSVTISQLPEIAELTCRVDGSWVEGWMGGAGFVFQKEEELLVYKTARTQVCCALQAEAVALWEALQYAEQEGIGTCTFITDCQVLAQACTDTRPPLEVDWRAHKEIYNIWRKLKQCLGFSCIFMGRGHNDLADSLARKGRQMGGSYIGYTYPIYPIG